MAYPYWLINPSELVAFWSGTVLGQRLPADDDPGESRRVAGDALEMPSVMRLTVGSFSTKVAQPGEVGSLHRAGSPAGSGRPWRCGPLAVAVPQTRPTSRCGRANIVPNVMIWATWSWPYLRPT